MSQKLKHNRASKLVSAANLLINIVEIKPDTETETIEQQGNNTRVICKAGRLTLLVAHFCWRPIGKEIVR